MKKAFYLILFVLFVFACKENTSGSTEAETPTESVDTIETVTVEEEVTVDSTDQAINKLENDIDSLLNDVQN